MSNFITEASAELEHVVWPTPVENKKYMIYTTGVIVVIGIFLAVLGYIVTNSLSFTRDQFPHDTIIPTVSSEDTIPQAEIDKLLENIEIDTGSTKIDTGSVKINTGSVNSTPPMSSNTPTASGNR